MKQNNKAKDKKIIGNCMCWYRSIQAGVEGVEGVEGVGVDGV